MKNFATKSLITLILCLLPAISYADVSKIAFTTDPQSIKPNELSGPITIQAQDSSGNSYQTPETIDLEFTSTSATGEFLGSSGNTATKYMSTNTANRTFYYRDSSSGTFTLKVSGKGRTSGKEWNISQSITISSLATSASSNSSKISSSNIISVDSSSTYSNTSAGAVNQTPISTSFEVFAGDDRLTSAGSPISFGANVKKAPTGNKIEFSWSFGDGSVGGNQSTFHTYKYPGKYAVALNARSGSYQTVSRLEVEVIKPELDIKEDEESVIVSNLSDKEINLFNWKLKSGIKGFIFQPDTILLPHSSVQFDKQLLKFDSGIVGGLSLEDSLGRKISPAEKTEETLPPAQLVMTGEDGMQDQTVSLEKEEKLLEAGPENDTEVKDISQTASVATAVLSATSSNNVLYEAPKKEGFLTKLTNFIKRVFSR